MGDENRAPGNNIPIKRVGRGKGEGGGKSLTLCIPHSLPSSLVESKGGV